MSVKKFVNVLLVTTVPLAFTAFSASANADCDYDPWKSVYVCDVQVITGTNPPPDPYDPYAGLFPGGGGGGGGGNGETPEVKEILDKQKLPCRPANETPITFSSNNWTACYLQAYDDYAARYGVLSATFARPLLDKACDARLQKQPVCQS